MFVHRLEDNGVVIMAPSWANMREIPKGAVRTFCQRCGVALSVMPSSLTVRDRAIKKKVQVVIACTELCTSVLLADQSSRGLPMRLATSPEQDAEFRVLFGVGSADVLTALFPGATLEWL